MSQPPSSTDATRPTETLGEDYFDRIYAEASDPWGFATSAYEAEKYARTLESLPRDRYRRCLEIGCSIGVLSEMLLVRCEGLFATEINDRALKRARERNGKYQRGRFQKMNFPEEVPEGTFDLVVLSEVAYYWGAETFARAQALVTERLLEPGGHLALVHYTPTETDYPMTGDEVHERWLAMPQYDRVREHRGDRYRLDVLQLRA